MYHDGNIWFFLRTRKDHKDPERVISVKLKKIIISYHIKNDETY